ncbi:glycogen synthase [Mucilaginibacter arboris]|uniref:Glycogen synthase n=1 Tax=Mucilaginibacter arboris TaxID=2682090 RepID=A0A7K1SS63_9SPHI|nr:glycogen/starch synthase [Mucilaginibacter arboris]MVN20143.1 glycosyltransferase [Mucilaginibacter arboris]
MKVIHLSAECYPVAKIGGLGDVAGALPKYLNQAGVEAVIMMPFYERKFVQENAFDTIFQATTTMGNRPFFFEILKERTGKLGFDLYILKIPGLLDRTEVYGYDDDIERFVAFQLAFLDWMLWSGEQTDIIHCHDHQTGLVPFLLYNSFRYTSLSNIRTVFTIHNGQYHGAFGWEKFSYLPDVDPWRTGLLDWNGGINPLASAVKCADAFTTVSPSYLQELAVSSNGLEFLFELEKDYGTGIINGIDTDVWDPKTDPMISAKYTAKTVSTKKLKNKQLLCQQFGFTPDKPLFTFIGRLVVEKGADLLPELFRQMLADQENPSSILVLGSGNEATEHELSVLKEAFPGQYNAYIGYNEELAHRIYAGADFILMPSRVEPCGLNQLYALRYGTLPIVNSTGGLKDTVIDISETGGYGIRCNGATVPETFTGVKRAIELFKNTAELQLLYPKVMALDFSWDRSAKEYINLYQSLKPKL